jgi:hypothetical protein
MMSLPDGGAEGRAVGGEGGKAVGGEGRKAAKPKKREMRNILLMLGNASAFSLAETRCKIPKKMRHAVSRR